jgi:hypothetical protein
VSRFFVRQSRGKPVFLVIIINIIIKKKVLLLLNEIYIAPVPYVYAHLRNTR